MARAESFGEGLWVTDSLPDDFAALLGAFLQSPIAAAFAALVIALFIAVGLLGRTGAPSVVPVSGSLGADAALRLTSSRTQAEHMPQGSGVNYHCPLIRDTRQADKQFSYERESVSRSHFTRDNALQPFARVRPAQVLDLRLFGARSNASLERGPPGRGTSNSIAGRRTKSYPSIGASKAGLR
jgi:hypothetical protein